MEKIIETTAITVGHIPELEIDKNLQIKNIENANQKLEQLLSKYQNTIVTAENLKDWEKDSRSLGGLATKLTKARTTAKNEFMLKIEPFENEIKAMVEKISNAKIGIDSQTRLFEEERVKEAKENIWKQAKQIACELNVSPTYFELLFEVNQKWLNRGSKEKDVIIAITEKLEFIKIEQTKEEKRKRLIAEKEELITFECESVSAQLELVNAIKRTDVQFAEEASLIEIKKTIFELASCRKKQEEAVEKKQIEAEELKQFQEKKRREAEEQEELEREQRERDWKENNAEGIGEQEKEVEFIFDDLFEETPKMKYAIIAIGPKKAEYCFLVIDGICERDHVVCNTVQGYVVGQVLYFTDEIEQTKRATKYAFQKVVYPQFLGGKENDK